MPAHQAGNRSKLDAAFLQKDSTAFGAVELEGMEKLDVTGKYVAHLFCNNGVELTIFKTLRANLCVGFYICDIAIEEAHQRASNTDIVYIHSGSLGWIPDFTKFLAKTNSLLLAAD